MLLAEGWAEQVDLLAHTDASDSLAVEQA